MLFREIHRKNKTIPADSGYSKAVDMWSIGIITGTLLSGVTFWVVQNPVHSEVNLRASVLELSSRCDLAFLDDRRDRIWRNVGSKPKDFMKRLVILKEQCRMTATQALTHPWFTNNCHVATFDAVYENSVRDWRPRGPVDLLVESISQLSSELPDSVISNKFLTQEVVSRYFAPPRESSSSGKYDSSGSRPDLALVSRLSSIEEEGDAPYTPSRERSSPPSYNPDEGVRYHEQNGKLSASIGTLSVAIDGKYTRNKATTKQDEPLVARSSDVINAGIDSIYPFSIPDGPPHSPELRREFVLIPETPIRHVKRRREQQASRTLGTSREPQGDAEKAVKRQKTCYFARLPSKRAKLHH